MPPESTRPLLGGCRLAQLPDRFADGGRAVEFVVRKPLERRADAPVGALPLCLPHELTLAGRIPHALEESLHVDRVCLFRTRSRGPAAAAPDRSCELGLVHLRAALDVEPLCLLVELLARRAL